MSSKLNRSFPAIAGVLFVVLWALAGGFYLMNLNVMRGSSRANAEEVVEPAAIASAIGVLEWNCDGYQGRFEIDESTEDMVDSLSDRLDDLGYYLGRGGRTEHRELTYHRDREDNFDYDLVTLKWEEDSVSVFISVWDTDMMTCVPSVLARDLGGDL